VGYSLKDTLSDHGSVSRAVCKEEGGKLLSINEVTKIKRENGAIIDEESGTTLEPETIVSMNFWICNDSIFDYILGYFKTFLNDTSNHEKNEIYLPFVAQDMMSNGLIDVEVIDSKSDWFGVTYYDDKVEAVNKLLELTNSGSYPSPIW